MKKILTLIMMLILSVVVAGCTDKKYKDDSVNIIFFTNSNEGASEVMPLVGVEPGTLIDKPEDPVRAGYTFCGWYKDITFNNPWDFETDRVGDKSFVIYAKWDSSSFKIIYDWNGGTPPTTDYKTEYKTGDNSILPIPKRTGYQFLGWYDYDWDENDPYTKPGDHGYQTIPADASGDLELYAHWKAIKVSVTFKVNFPIEGQGPQAPTSIVITYGDVINFPTLPDTAGYRFIGWNMLANGEGAMLINGEQFTRTLRTTVHAIWEKIN